MTNHSQTSVNINISQLMIALVVSMAMACGFVAYITNTIVNSKVNALTTVANPASSTAAPQSNVAGGLCVDPSAPAGPTATQGDAVLGASGVGLSSALRNGGSVSLAYNLSNSSTTNTSNTSTTVDSRFSGNTSTLSFNNGNTLNSGNTANTATNTTTNTTTTTVANNGNTLNSGNTATSTTTTNTNNVLNSGNTANTATTTVTNTDLSNNSTNVNVTDNTVVVIP